MDMQSRFNHQFGGFEEERGLRNRVITVFEVVMYGAAAVVIAAALMTNPATNYEVKPLPADIAAQHSGTALLSGLPLP